MQSMKGPPESSVPARTSKIDDLSLTHRTEGVLEVPAVEFTHKDPRRGEASAGARGEKAEPVAIVIDEAEPGPAVTIAIVQEPEKLLAERAVRLHPHVVDALVDLALALLEGSHGGESPDR